MGTILGWALAVGLPCRSAAAPRHFTEGAATAARFGVHEIALRGGEAGNPFDKRVSVAFVPPSGERAKTVEAFYDGDGMWRARVYVAENGWWTWSATCPGDAALDGRTGRFRAAPSRLRGRLLPHRDNPRQWMTEDGRWFLNLSDTAYFLLSAYDAAGGPISDSDVALYLRDVERRGITSLRCFGFVGPKGFADQAEVTRWDDAILDRSRPGHLRLESIRTADRRLRGLLDRHPGLYVQFILFPRGAGYKQDDGVWSAFPPETRERVLRYIAARFAAYPQIFWLSVNDTHYGPGFPKNNALAREVGEWFRRHDPWQHPMAAGHARFVDYQFGGEAWSTYLHLEHAYDANAAQAARYRHIAKPVFLGEDRYENDHLDRDPDDMNYFQRRLFWSWLLAGGSANYGGRWWNVTPYSLAGARPSGPPRKNAATFSKPLRGLDSTRVIRDWFERRGVDLSRFEPGPSGGMRRGSEEHIFYMPNAAAEGKAMRADAGRRAVLSVDPGPGRFRVDWLRAADGREASTPDVEGGRRVELAAPWSGCDAVVRLQRQSAKRK